MGAWRGWGPQISSTLPIHPKAEARQAVRSCPTSGLEGVTGQGLGRVLPLPLLQLEGGKKPEGGARKEEGSCLELGYSVSGGQPQMSASGSLRRPPCSRPPEGGAQAFLWLGAKDEGQWGRGSC